MRLLYPHSLSYQATTRMWFPSSTSVCSPSTIALCESPMMSLETSSSLL